MNLKKINIPLTVIGTIMTYFALENVIKNVNINAAIGVIGLFCISYGLHPTNSK